MMLTVEVGQVRWKPYVKLLTFSVSSKWFIIAVWSIPNFSIRSHDERLNWSAFNIDGHDNC